MEIIAFGSKDVDNILQRDPTRIEFLPFGAVLLDRMGKIVKYNSAEGVIVGRSAADVIGRNFFNDVAPCAKGKKFHGEFLKFSQTGNVNTTGYVRVQIDGKGYLMHRAVWFFHKKKWPLEINHLDGDKLNCAIENLEDCTRKANQTHALGKPCAAFVGGKKVAVFPSIVDAAAWAKVRYQSLAKAIKTGEVKAGYRWRAA